MEVLDILKKSLSHENVPRKEAESAIVILAHENFGFLLMSLTDILQNEQIEKPIRQLSSILFKNLITNNIEYKGRWSTLENQIKEQIKQKIIATLASPEIFIKKASALALAGKKNIYAQEFVRWILRIKIHLS